MEEENQIELNCSEEECITKAYQSANVCLPVTVTPFANVGEIKTECCGDAIISRDDKCCKGAPNKSCRFTITQKIKVEIPVEFGANTNVGGTFINCDCTREQ